MKRLSVLLWAPVILFSACAFALDGPSADEILRKAEENEKRIRIVRQQYTYQFHQEYHKANGDGTAGRLIHSRDSDVIFLGSNQFWKPVLIDGKPLDEKQLEQLKADMRKAAARNHAPVEEQEEKDSEYTRRRYDYNMGSLSDVLRLKNSTLLREELLNGRKAWVIQSEPKRDVIPSSPLDRQLLCYRNLLWIDQQDLALVKQEFSVLREYAEPGPKAGGARPLKPGSFLRVIYSRVNDSDWFPSSSFFYLRRRYPAGTISFGDDRLVSEETYTNYKKYDVKTAITFDPDQQ